MKRRSPRPLWRWWLFCFACWAWFEFSWGWSLHLLGWCVLPTWVASDEEIAAAHTAAPNGCDGRVHTDF